MLGSKTQIGTALSSARSAQLALELERQLPALAPTLITQVPENENFIKNPDAVEEHHVDWHQYGIITHTYKVREAYHKELLPLLEGWMLRQEADRFLGAKMEGDWTRGELFEISIPLHDLGKLRRKHVFCNGASVPDYTGHEAISEEIVRNNPQLQRSFADAGLNAAHVDYVARLAGLHFELGKVRDVAKRSGGFSMSFSSSAAAVETYAALRAQYPQYAVEIGLWYLVDSMGKMSSRFDALSDEEISRSREQEAAKLARGGLRASLINAVLQYPVNIAVGRAYLERCLR